MDYVNHQELTLSEFNRDRFTENIHTPQTADKGQHFIEANTLETTLWELKSDHIIPVYIKDNETLISQAEFIESTLEVVKEYYGADNVLDPILRVSHPMKGRIPEARNKSANDLLEHEKTLYYERLAFIIEVPSVKGMIAGNELSLTIGGVKSYSYDNFYGKKGADEHFKIFIGFKNTVCTNMCVWSDGYVGDLKVKSLAQLITHIRSIIQNYNSELHLKYMGQFANYHLSEQQFATIIGKCRMYHHLPVEMKKNIPALLLGDTQISTVCRSFYRDNNFASSKTGDISLWNLYNLFTGANKSSYIDSFLDRAVNSFSLLSHIQLGLENKTTSWYLN